MNTEDLRLKNEEWLRNHALSDLIYAEKIPWVRFFRPKTLILIKKRIMIAKTDHFQYNYRCDDRKDILFMKQSNLFVTRIVYVQ